MAEIELLIGGQKIDLFNTADNPVKLSYILLDLQFIDKRGGTISNVIKLPATKNNNQAFGFYYDTQSTQPEQFVIAKDASISVNGINVFLGTATGKASFFNKTPQYYETLLKGDNLEWATYLKELPIVNLDLPTIDYNEATVKASWTNDYTDGYVAPLALYGAPVNYGTLPMVWNYKDFRYWLFAYPLIKEAFASAGYKLDSTFIESDFFKKWCIYFCDTDIYRQDSAPTEINFKLDVIDPDRNCLDMITGIANRFSLMFFTDNDLKVVYCEPFDTFFGNARTLDSKLDLDKNAKLSQYRDVMKNIILTGKLDAFGEWYQNTVIPQLTEGATSGGLTTQPISVFNELVSGRGFYKSGFKLADVQDQDVKENYYEDYMTGVVLMDSTADSRIYMPIIFDSDAGFSSLLPLWPKVLDAPEQAGASGPCLGYYAGMKTMKDAYQHFAVGNKFQYHADIPIGTRPLIYLCDYAEEDTGENYYYSDQWNSLVGQWTLLNLAPTPDLIPIIWPWFTVRKMPGLVRKYYRNILYSIFYGRYLEAPLKITPGDILSKIQRDKVQLYHTVWAMLEITNFNPANDNPTVCKLLETLIADQDFLDSLVYGGDFTTWYDWPF